VGLIILNQSMTMPLIMHFRGPRSSLKSEGYIQARKDEKARLQHLKECTQNNELPRIEDIISAQEPDKQPTQIEALSNVYSRILP
jgi:hypothetical protein